MCISKDADPLIEKRPAYVSVKAMTYLLEQVMYVFIVNLTERNPDGESDVGRNVQTEAVHLRDAVHTAVRAQRGAWRHTNTHVNTHTHT